jgi:hypothetical protein
LPAYAWLVLTVCAAVFVLRGPLRAADAGVNMDAPLLLAAALAWRDGGNPYDPASVAAAFGDRAEAIAPTLRRGQQAFVYPPPAYALLAPLTYLPWSAQRPVWNLLNCVMLLAALVLVCRLAEVSVRSLEGVAIVSLGLVTNPSQICIALGQTGVAAFFLMVLSWVAAPPGDPAGARHQAGLAVLTAAAAAIVKPQIAAVFLLCDLFTSRRRVALLAGSLAAAALVVAIAAHGGTTQVVASWLGNLRALMAADADPLYGSLPHQLINLQSPLAVLIGNRAVATAIAVAGCVLFGAAYGWVARRPAPPDALRELGSLAAAAVLMLLVFYHRIYDAVFLMVPAAFAIRQIGRGDRRGWALLAVLLPLWVPLASITYRLFEPAAGFSTGVAVQAFAVQHQTWCLVAAFMLLLDVRRRPALGRPAPAAAPLPVSP